MAQGTNRGDALCAALFFAYTTFFCLHDSTDALQAPVLMRPHCKLLALPACHPSDDMVDFYWELQRNLPGWRWATITKVALDRLSRSLHSDVCDSDGLRDAAIHSTISGRGGRRDCATSNNILRKEHFTSKCFTRTFAYQMFPSFYDFVSIMFTVRMLRHPCSEME